MYPIACTKADSAPVVSGVRERRPIIVNASGNIPLPIPANTIQTHAPPVGAMPRPMYATTKHSPSTLINSR